MDLLVLGPQGAGKGTQAARISAEHEIPHIATGDVFRAAIAAGTPLGLQVKPILESGHLVPDEVTVSLIRERLAQDDAADGFVLDGFPRNLAQADALDSMLTEIGRELDAILYLQVSDAVGIARALERAKREGRADDNADVIAKRLDIYHRETEPIVEHYRTTGKLVPLRAERSIDEVWTDISDALQVLA